MNFENFENFIANTDSTANIIVKGIGVKSDWVHTTTPNNVSINGERVMLYDHKLQRYIHTTQKDLKSFEKK